MAEIKIEKKAPVWPWILAIIIIAALLLYFLVFNDDKGETVVVGTERDTTEQVTEDDQNITNDGAVAEYVQLITSDRAMGLDHEYTNEAFESLRNAIEARAEQVGYDISADMEQIKDHRDHITNDPYETTHANHIRGAAMVLTNAMQNLQRAHFPNVTDKMEEVRKAADSIDANTLTLEQKSAVKSFFDKSAELLQNMN